MATTRIMPLHIGKGRTESQAISDIIDYVANPQKTDNGKLITSYGCDSRTADADSEKQGKSPHQQGGDQKRKPLPDGGDDAVILYSVDYPQYFSIHNRPPLLPRIKPGTKQYCHTFYFTCLTRLLQSKISLFSLLSLFQNIPAAAL